MSGVNLSNVDKLTDINRSGMILEISRIIPNISPSAEVIEEIADRYLWTDEFIDEVHKFMRVVWGEQER